MNIEEPQACNIISLALNATNRLAMLPTEMEALSVLSGEITSLVKSSAVADTISFKTVKERVRRELDLLVDDPDFVHAFRYVVDMGADGAQFLADLRDFTQRFVDHKALMD